MQTLRDTRRKKLMSIRDLAAATGIATRTIVDIEHGRVTPRLRTMRILSLALGAEPLSIVEFARAIDAGQEGGEAGE